MDGFMILGIVLLAAGFLFVGIETLIPGFGAPGILGGCCLVAGVFLIADSVQEAVIIVAVVLLLLAVLIFTLVTLLAKGRLKTPIILNDKMNKEELLKQYTKMPEERAEKIAETVQKKIEYLQLFQEGKKIWKREKYW